MTEIPGVEYTENAEADYAVVTITEPFKQPFDRIPNAYKNILEYLQANNFKQKQKENVISCFEYEYEKDVVVLTALSKRAFDSDVQVGGTSAAGPPGYQSEKFYAKMAGQKHLFTFMNDGLIVGGAVLFKEAEKLYIGRIFIDTNHFREGLGTKLMEEIESLYPEYKRDDEFIYYAKTL